MASAEATNHSIPIKQLHEAFVHFDKNDSNSLTFDEILVLCKETFGQDVKLSEISDLFKDIDEDKNNEISFDEFVAWWRVGRQKGRKAWMVKNYLSVVHGVKAFDEKYSKFNEKLNLEG